MMKRAFAAAAVLAVLVAPTVFAQRGPGACGAGMGPGGPAGMMAGGGPGGDFGQHRVEAVTQVLQLTQEQVTAWQSIRDNAHATIKPLADQMRQIRADVRTALDAGGADAAAVGAKLIAAHDLGAKIKSARDAAQTAFRALLTSEQQAKFDLLRQMEQGMGRGRHMGRGPQGF